MTISSILKTVALTVFLTIMQHHKFLAALPLALAVSAAWAADDGYTTLDTSVVSASGYAQDTREAPASITVIDSKELMTKPIGDIGTAVSDVPGVDITTTKMGTSQIYIRGFSSDYTLLMADGRRQNSDSAMNSLNGFEAGGIFMPPPGAVERVEVMRGPASTIYGSDGIGGAVNIIMKKHVNQFTGSLSIDRTQFTDSDWDDRWSAGAYLGIPLKEGVASLLLRGRYFDREKSNLHSPSGGYASHSPSDGYTGNVGGRLNLSPNENNDLYLDVDYTHFKGGSMSTSQAGYEAHRWFDKYAVVVGHDGRFSFGDLSTYFQFQGLDLIKTKTGPATRTDGVSPGMLATANKTTKGSLSDPLMSSKHYVFATKLKTPVSLDGYGDMIVQTGLDVDYSTFKDNFNEGTEITGKTLDQTQIAVFGESEYFINENWIATLGARVHWSDIFDFHFAPRAYLVWKPAEAFSIKGGVANGYRTPEARQLTDGAYSVSVRGAPNHTYGNPDLKPEESWNYELSSTVKLGQAASVTAGVFYTDFKNKIDTVKINYVNESNYDAQDVNFGKVTAKGVELLFQTAAFYGVSFKGGYTYTHAEIEGGVNDGLRPNSMPRHSINARADYDNGGLNVFVKALAKLDAMSEQISSGKGGSATYSSTKYKNYTQVDIGVNYTFEKQHHFSAALNNVFDKGLEYGADGSNVYREFFDGRNVWLGYTYTF